MDGRMTVVLFLCTHNAARSQMAEALLRRRAGGRFDAYSGGLEPTAVHPLAERAMNEIGVGLEGHRSKNVAEYLGKLPVDYAVTLCKDAEDRCPRLWPFVLREVLSWPFDDPSATAGSEEVRMEAFRRVRDGIDERIREWLLEVG